MAKVFVVSLVKDEIDIFPFIIEHLLDQEVDGFYIADNMSTDGTRDMLSDYAKTYKNFCVVDDTEVGHYHSDKMDKYIAAAVDKYGADIIIPNDGDELWFSKDNSLTLSEALRRMPCEVATAVTWNMVPQPTDQATGNPLVDTVHRENAVISLPSVAFRYRAGVYIHHGNHGVNYPVAYTNSDDIIGIRHFQYRSFEQYKRKFRNGKKAYDVTDLPEIYGSHWRQNGGLTDEELWNSWQYFINQPGLVYDPAPLRRAR